MVATPQPMTLEQFLRLPEKKPPLEHEDGEVTRKVSPKTRHVVVQKWLVEQVDRNLGRRKVAMAFPELRVTFGGQSLVPDISVFGWARLPRTPAGEWIDDVYQPPDLVVEVVSPGQSVSRLVRRCLWYVANGVHAALLVDPDDRSVLLFRPDAVPLPIRGDEKIELGDLLPGFELRADQLFAVLGPTPTGRAAQRRR
jgi:Uma2 family endonuclease